MCCISRASTILPRSHKGTRRWHSFVAAFSIPDKSDRYFINAVIFIPGGTLITDLLFNTGGFLDVYATGMIKIITDPY